MKHPFYVLSTVAVLSWGLGDVAFAENDAKEKTEEAGEKIEESAESVKQGVKKGSHRVGEKVCEMVNGKEHCIWKKIKNRVKEKTEELKDKAD